MKSLKLIILFTFLVISAKADFSAHPVNKWMNGDCQTTFYLITTGEAGPFTVDIEKDNLNIYHEENLPSDVKMVSIADYGQFTVIFTDAFGCTKEVIVDALCDCDDLEYKVIPASCHLDNGTIEIISPMGAMMTSEWTQWPSGIDAPLNNALIVNNLIPGIYVATFNISIPDPASGDFISCEFEESFDLTDCNCELELKDTYITVEGTTACTNPNGSISMYNSDMQQIVFNYAGLLSDLQFKWTDDDGTVLQVSDQFGNVGIDNLAEGFYHLTISDISGCEVSKTFEIKNKLELFLGETIVATCEDLDNGSIYLSPFMLNNGGFIDFDFSILWSTGEADESFIDELVAGTYYATLTDNISGCEYYESFELNEYTNSEIGSVTKEISKPKCDGDPAIVTLNIEGGTPPYDINWTPDLVNNELYNSGFYVAEITDACEQIKTVNFNLQVGWVVYDELSNLEVDEVIDCEAYNGTTTLTFEGGKPPFKIYETMLIGLEWELLESTFQEKRSYEVPYDGFMNTYKVEDGCGDERIITKIWNERCEVDFKMETIKHPHPLSSNGSFKFSLHNNTCDLDDFCQYLSCPACDEVGGGFLYIPSASIFGIGITDDKIIYECMPAGKYEFFFSSPQGCTYSFTYELTSSGFTAQSECDVPSITPEGTYEYNSCKGNLLIGPNSGNECGISIVLGSNSGTGKVAGYLTSTSIGPVQIQVSSIVKNIQLSSTGNTPFDLDLSSLPDGTHTIKVVVGDVTCSSTNYFKITAPDDCIKKYCYKAEVIPGCNCNLFYEYCLDEFGCHPLSVSLQWITDGGPFPEECPDCLNNFQNNDEVCNEFLVSNVGNEDFYIIHNTFSNVQNHIPPHIVLSPLTMNGGVVSSNTIVSNNTTIFILGRDVLSTSNSFNNERLAYQSFNMGEDTLGDLQTLVDIAEAGSGSYAHFTFDTPFADIPIILPTLVHVDGDQGLEIQLKDVSRYGFKIKLRDVDNVLNESKREVSFIAIEEGETSIGGRKVVVSKTLNDINHNWTNISFPNNSGQSFPENHIPYFFAFPQTSNGAGSPFVMYQNLSQNGVEISLVSANEYITQESFSNQEVGYLILGVDEDCICDQPVTDIDYEMINPNCGMNNGRLEFKPIGGTPPYDFKVNGSTYVANETGSVELENLTEGTYHLEILDSKGCLYEEEIILVADELNMDDYLAENVECQGGEFNVTLNPLGGAPPYTYSWNNGNTTEELKSVGSGQYYVTVVDAEGCIGTRHFNLRNMYLSVSKEDAICGLDNGSLTAHPIGIAPFEYLWSNGATTSKIDGLAPGTYYVTATDAAGCTKSTFISIFPDGQVDLEYAHPFCSANNGYVEIIVDGVAPINYIWNTGAATSKIENLAPGDYTVTATDASGCISMKSVTLNNTNNVSLNGSGGNEGFSDGRFIPEGVTVNWSFNPDFVTDQLIISSDASGVIINTGGVTRGQESCCTSKNCCSDYFLGDYVNSSIELIDGSGFVLEGSPSPNDCILSGFLTGSFITQSDSYISLEVIGANCGGGTSWSTALSCTENTNNILAKMDMENSTNVEQELILSSEEENANSISIFPNPANSILYIDSYDQLKGFNLKILDVNGKTILKSKIENSREVIDVSHIPNGIYFIIIESSSSLISERVVINR